MTVRVRYICTMLQDISDLFGNRLWIKDVETRKRFIVVRRWFPHET